MKKMIVSMLLTVLVVGLAGCTNDSAGDAPATSNSTTESLGEAIKVEIDASAESADTNGMPLIFTPKLSGESGKELQYRWTFETDEGMNNLVGFAIPEEGPQKVITNKGEPVKFGLFAQIDWIPGAKTEFIIRLEVTEVDSSAVLATDEITIVGNEGIYSLK